MYDIFFVSKDIVDKESWEKFRLRFPKSQKINYVKSFDDLKSKAFTKLFWVVWDDLEILDTFNFEYVVPEWDEEYIQVFLNGNHYDGVAIFSKSNNVSQKELLTRFYINKKEINIIASRPRPYDIFEINSYEDYLNAINKSTTEMFWLVPKEVDIIDYTFDMYFSHHNVYDRNMHHVFQNLFRKEKTYTGVMLTTKNKTLSKKEIDYRFLIEKKQHEILVSKTKSYDIVFISYNEINADENYKKLLTRFPNAKRVHRVKGIHQAHIEAAKQVETEMFWVVDADAIIEENFNFDFQVSRYERDIVHVWRSRNPINDLIYGYGGVKLLPTGMTLNMDITSPDMTTSISTRFKVMPDVSNITAFNTDPFSTWKSAFRECVKLSSKTIDRQNDEETLERLRVWSTVGLEKPFGKYAISGAICGTQYGVENKANSELIAKINDFDWLLLEFNKHHGQ
jgi:hypothetical protein